MRYLLIVFALTACATPEQRAERMIANHGPTCEKLGLQPKTEAWANCILQQDAAQRAASSAAYGALQAGRPRTCTMLGAQMVCN